MNVKKQVGSTCLAVALITSLLAGCSSGTNTNGNNSNGNSNATSTAAPVTKDEKPTEISIFVTQNAGTENLTSDNVILKEIEKRTNTKLDITWVPNNTYAEKSKVTLSSGDITDLFAVTNIYDANVVNMATSGAFWDLTPYIKDYTNLADLPEDVWNNIKINGKIHGIPRIRPLDGGGSLPMIRKDWLDKLKLEVPETMDDLYAAAKAFTEQDPDGNGEADTFGIVGDVGADHMGSLGWVLEVFQGGRGAWKVQGDKLVPAFMEESEKQALMWLKQAFDEGVLTPDFAVLKGSQSRDLLMGNKAGMLGSAMNPQWLFTAGLRKIEPAGDVYPLPYLIGPEGKFAPKDSGNFGAFLIPKSVSEDKLMKILAFMDFGISDEGANLAIYGQEGVHYEEKDGFKVATPQAATDLVGQNYLGQIFGNFDKYQRAFLTGIPQDMYERNKGIIDEREKVSKGDPALGLISQTWLTVGPDLSKKVQDLRIKVIMGKEPMTKWDEFVEASKADSQWTKITAEMNEAYQKRQSQ
jgi:putative aldouronate transport system substrate-binding protein